MTLALCSFGILIICGGVWAWRRLRLAVLCGYCLLVLAWFAAPLTARLQVPTDIAYQWMPWHDVAPDTVPRNPLLGDLPLQMLPFRSLVRRSLLRGELPFWAHELGTGQPLLGNAQSAPFAPLHLLALPLPPLRALTVVVAWQTLLSLLLMHALLQALGCSVRAAAFGALAYTFSLYSICWSYHPMGMATAWLPGILLALVLLRRGDAGGLSGLVACLLGQVLSGHPETTAISGLAAAAWGAALLWHRQGVRRRTFAIKAAGGAVLALLLAAPAIVPVLDAIPDSARRAVVERHPDLVQPPPFAARSFAVVVDPLRLGSPREDSWTGPAATNFNELCSGYAGLLPLGVALAGALAAPRRIAPLVAAGAVALCVAWRLPPLFGLVRLLPVVGSMPLARFRLLYVLAIAMAGALALDPLAAAGAARRRAVVAGAIAALAIGVMLLPPAAPPTAWAQAWQWTALAGAAAAIACLLLPAARRAAPTVMVAALLAELAVLGYRFQPLVPATLDLSAPAAVRVLQAQQGAAGGPYRTLGAFDALHPNMGALYGLWDPRGNDPMQPAHAAFVVGRSMRLHYQVGRDPFLSPQGFRQPLLDLLGVRCVLTDHRQRMPPPWELAWEGQGGRIWRNPGALPLFFVPRRVLTSPDPARDLLASERPGEAAILPPSHARLAGPQSGTVSAAPIANGWVLDVVAPAGAVVASSVSFAAGWRATAAPGGPQPEVAEADGGFVALVVGPGSHHVQLTYQPAHWRLALALCLLGLAASAWLCSTRRTTPA